MAQIAKVDRVLGHTFMAPKPGPSASREDAAATGVAGGPQPRGKPTAETKRPLPWERERVGVDTSRLSDMQVHVVDGILTTAVVTTVVVAVASVGDDAWLVATLVLTVRP